MLDDLPDQYYTCGMENIFIPEKFLQAVYVETKSKTMVHGFFGQKYHAPPNFFVQEDYIKDKNLITLGGRQRMMCCRGVLSVLIL